MAYRSKDWGRARNDGLINIISGLNSRADPVRGNIIGLGQIYTIEQADMLFHSNGTFRKIITAPADEAVRAGFEIDADDNGNKIEQNSDVMNVLDSLGWEEAFSTALYWHRCYGGAVILPIFDGGGLLEEPLDTNNIKKVLQLRVYSARECTWFTRNSDPNDVHYGEPEMYIVNDQLTGVSFNVHASRVIVFPGETVPHHCRQERRDWGGFVLEYIYDQLLYKYDAANDYTSHLIERFSQGVLKIDNMANMCASEPANLQKYLQQIDMTRNILNTLAIDGKDDFELKNVTLTGLDGMLEKYQTALSAVTEIPVTILFGRSPGGQNATGAADFEQYHAMVQRIQRSHPSRDVWIEMIEERYRLHWQKVGRTASSHRPVSRPG